MYEFYVLHKTFELIFADFCDQVENITIMSKTKDPSENIDVIVFDSNMILVCFDLTFKT